MAEFFDRPTPGESLVVEPKSRPYERPAEMRRLGEVIDFYLSRISQDEVVYNTGDIVLINNTQIAHSGKLLSKGNKRAIAGYPDIPQNKINEEEVPFISVDELCKL